MSLYSGTDSENNPRVCLMDAILKFKNKNKSAKKKKKNKQIFTDGFEF